MASIYQMIESVRSNRPRHGSRGIWGELSQTKNIQIGEMYFSDQNLVKKVFAKALVDQVWRHTMPQRSNNLLFFRHAQSADKALGTFWANIRKWAKVYLKHLNLQSSEQAELLGIVSVDISSDKIHRLQTQEKIIQSVTEDQSKPKQITLQTQWGSTEVQAPLQTTKLKVNSRLPPSQVMVERDVKTPRNFDEPCQTYAYVKKNTLDVIRLMFSNLSQAGCESVAWEKFLQAMCDAGYVVRNGSGSAVIFEAKDMQSGWHRGKIIFHRPHPVAKLDPIMLRSMRKRMAKWLAWSTTRFRLKGS